MLPCGMLHARCSTLGRDAALAACAVVVAGWEAAFVSSGEIGGVRVVGPGVGVGAVLWLKNNIEIRINMFK
jgi:hypothetical protein